MGDTGHEALLMVDAVSSLVATDYRHDDWGVDVCVAGSQKALMLPPGLSFTAVSDRALDASRGATLPSGYWSWDDMARFNERGFFPYTPATNLLYGLDEALRMLEAEGLEQVVARHARHAEATRRAVDAWGLENYCQDSAGHSNAATTVCVPDGTDAEVLRRTILDRFDMSLGKGLGPLEGTVFRIGHLGNINDLTLMGALSGVEMGLRTAGVPHRPGGAKAALEFLAE
jgi:alanine-glyoxylate transaminase/serine-glyoxylate transaminase/serine-pyruvate transaminase